MKKKRWLLMALALILLLPLWMWLAWLFSPKTKLVAAIVDKTVLTQQGQEHLSFTWILNHKRLTKTRRKSYNAASDYFGFFPLRDEKFRLKGLERFSTAQLQQLSADADLVYVTDTYGIYKNEWFSGKANTERSGMLYGGMSDNDVKLLANMKAKHKLVVAEFNSIASPTPAGVRSRFEQLFGMHWTGWTARYFDSFDTLLNKELPHWLTAGYKREHGGKWPFHRPGVAFVNDGGRVAILEDSTHLTDPMPHIMSLAYGQKQLGLPPRIKYPFWFDVLAPDLAVNHVISRFDIAANKNGRAELAKYGIPATFPAVLMHRGDDYRFYYFSGDFCDNPINFTTSYFKGIGFFKFLFYNTGDPAERGSFFWTFYQPLMNHILDEEVQRKNRL
ncbi:hypothetical protein [Mucilaginibacter sp. L3T2-6]|uniref:hypothetical protein n=1 Tax=Mucilaginibacter sp. L3T2-6 TaxID=3062491 RepID=UPI00267529E7|nr:hypothetical protein [Mucilaginibacter sp. L3T2-6]MDO3645338.1 hypothetical protein [Mucilaginibacter sp. L3T2-6]MDV6217831.1 hypothetical protein [Mucilaginibacter sp. L3T2-6]